MDFIARKKFITLLKKFDFGEIRRITRIVPLIMDLTYHLKSNIKHLKERK
jgi:hypothetical protein